jgi:protein ImuB
MQRRFVSIWFPHLITDWFTICNPSLRKIPFVVRMATHGRMIVYKASPIAQMQGIHEGMVLADARAIIPGLVVHDEKPGLPNQLLKRLALWCIRFTPFAAVDLPNGLILDVSGCAHLWGGDELYVKEIIQRLQERGYHVRAAMADTIGAAWAVARYGKGTMIVERGAQINALLGLPAAALRLDQETVERLDKLGLRQIKDFLHFPRPALRRRFGAQLLQRINQAVGKEDEVIEPVQPIEPYTERLPCLEPIITNTGIEIALRRLLDLICKRLQEEQKGLRVAIFKAYQINGGIAQIVIETNGPSSHADHLYKLFEIKLPIIQPESGIELFVIEAKRIEDHAPEQENIWEGTTGANDIRITQLLDRLMMKIGADRIHRFLPDAHYLPERSMRAASSVDEKPVTEWKTDLPRPIQLLARPERIEVTAPIPDYPPMLFRYKGKLHKIKKADGPERIEQEWWIQPGEHRDYYYVEDEEGCRYWLFREGHYDANKTCDWYLHGFFA